MTDLATGNGTRPVPSIRAERKGRGWTAATMVKKLRDAAEDPQRDVPDLDSLRHNIYRWESGGYGVSERYRHLYCRAFRRTEWELFGIEPPEIASDDGDDGEGTGMPYAKASLRSDKRILRERMRAAGLEYRQITTEFSRVYRLRPRAAWREAYRWSLQDAANAINAFKGDTGLDPGGCAARSVLVMTGNAEAAPQAAEGAGLPRTGWACNQCRQPVIVAGGDPETAGTVLHLGERNEGDVGHVAAPIEAALVRGTG